MTSRVQFSPGSPASMFAIDILSFRGRASGLLLGESYNGKDVYKRQLPRPTRTHGTSMAASSFRKESVTHRYTACSPAQAAPTTTIVATINRAGRTSKSPVLLATS